jgi:hypothetical protein
MHCRTSGDEDRLAVTAIILRNPGDCFVNIVLIVIVGEAAIISFRRAVRVPVDSSIASDVTQETTKFKTENSGEPTPRLAHGTGKPNRAASCEKSARGLLLKDF